MKIRGMCFDTEKTQGPPVDHSRIDKEERKAPGFGRNRDYADAPGRPMSDSEIVAELFKYHAPSIEQIPRYAAINQAAKNFAEIILLACPPGTDRSTAIYHIRMARMTANAAIALNGLSL